MTRFINSGTPQFYLGYTHGGEDFVFGLTELHSFNLTRIELGRRAAEGLEQ
jgi:hypothetical protein